MLSSTLSPCRRQQLEHFVLKRSPRHIDLFVFTSLMCLSLWIAKNDRFYRKTSRKHLHTLGVVYMLAQLYSFLACAPCCYRDRKQDNPSVYIMKKNTKKRKRQKERKGDHVKPKKEVSKEAAQDSNMPWA